MKMNIMGKKSIVIWLALLLLLNFNLITTISSEAIYYNDDGVWIDNFKDSSSISDTLSKNYNLSGGCIFLGSGSNVFYYDYNVNSGETLKHEAWESDSSIIPDYPEFIHLRNLLGETNFTTSGYTAIKNKKDSLVEETQSSLVSVLYTNSPVHHFRLKVNQNKNNIDAFRFSWWYGDQINNANIKGIKLYAWDYSAILKRWINVGNIIDSYSDIDPDGILGDICFTSNDTGYINDEGYIDFLVVGIPPYESGSPCILTTDYVNLSVTTEKGFISEGCVVSTDVSPSELGGWESVVWSGSRASDISSIKIQILDEDGKLIDNLKGNSDGYTNGNIDLSSLSSSIEIIRLKANFYSSDLSVTPRLYNWAVTWQTQVGRFHDSFTTDIRVDKGVSIEIDSGNVKMSGFFSDWNIFGGNSANTRSYDGEGPQEPSLYWVTEDETVGGGLHSPVMSNGVIYVASSKDDRVYAYDSTVSSGDIGEENSYIDRSKNLNVVDSAVAIADDYVIVATSEVDGFNNIIALDKTNLSDEKWRYPGTDETICFSSAPTFSNEKIFVTSWNGKSWDTPLLSFIYKFQILKGQNKIIALNQVDGSKVWDVDLPAGSFSTPAVADGMVYVGCDNIYGSSLFAFDEETGETIWNISVGLVGGASPVVYKDKVFIVAKDQRVLPLKGSVNVIAVDKNTGEMEWNFTIADNIPAFEFLPKILKFYTLMVTSTPAIYNDILYVNSPDGKTYALNTDSGNEIWSIDLSSKILGILPTYSCTSPAVADNMVYVASPNGTVSALGAINGDKKWQFNCNNESLKLLPSTFILSSPIVADGVLYVGVTEDINNFNGRIYSIGNYTPNRRASVISNPINIPPGHWWKKFNVENNTDGKITYSILDDDYNVLISNVLDNQDISNSASLNSGSIRLYAEFYRENSSHDPALHSWSVTWENETSPPVFDEDSFTPGSTGWINTDTPVCKIDVSDARPGLDVESAEFMILYTSNLGISLSSSWYSAICTGESGTRNKQEITADISGLDIKNKIIDLTSITITINDLAGNTATFKQGFKKDMVKPTSNIKDIGSFMSHYNTAVTIKANASDPGVTNENKSGIKTVSLYYRSTGSSEWNEFSSQSKSPYHFSFSSDVSDSYEFCTIATDNADNIQGFPSSEELSFVFDKNKPDKPVFNDEYRFNSQPEFSLEFIDDYRLETVEYRMNFEGLNEWTIIKDDINREKYIGEWNISKGNWEYMDKYVEYFIYFRLTDTCGNQYETNYDTEALKIIKDLDASRSYLNLDDISEWQWDDKFTITANITDEYDVLKVELHYRYSSDNKHWNDWKQYGDNLTNSPYEWEFTAKEGSGYYKFKTKVWDSAGNIEESEIESIRVTIFPMILLLIMAILVFIFIIFTIFILVKMKKKKAIY